MGTGWVATARHIPAFKRDRRARIVAVFDRDDAKAKNVARQFKAPQHSNNLDDFLRTPIAAVAICTPPMTHAEAIEAALQAGKHVLVEKPMTLTANEGRALEALANEKGLLLCPSHNFLFSHSVRKVEALLRNGEAGTVQWAMGIQLSSWRRRLPTWYGTLPGGLFFDEAPHLLYLMQRLSTPGRRRPKTNRNLYQNAWKHGWPALMVLAISRCGPARPCRSGCSCCVAPVLCW
jgi:predicted dehydrogenase